MRHVLHRHGVNLQQLIVNLKFVPGRAVLDNIGDHYGCVASSRGRIVDAAGNRDAEAECWHLFQNICVLLPDYLLNRIKRDESQKTRVPHRPSPSDHSRRAALENTRRSSDPFRSENKIPVT